METLLVVAAIVAIFGLVLVGKYRLDKYDLESELEIVKHDRDEQREAKESNQQIIKERDMKIASIVSYFRNGVFYDKENDTIVLAENLERIGEFE